MNGKNIDITVDYPDDRTYLKLADFSATTSGVNQLMSSDMGKWDEELIRDWFDSATATSILYMPINRYAPSGQNHMLWLPEKNGFFTTRSTYRVLTKNEQTVLPMFKQLWSQKDMQPRCNDPKF